MLQWKKLVLILLLPCSQKEVIMQTIRFWVETLKLLPCAATVFLAYAKMGYYPWYKATSAIGSYYKEKKKLNARVLVEYFWKFIPIGTLMCTVDSGWLPVDDVFPQQMQKIRQADTRLGYFGKFAVIPFMHGRRTGQRLIRRAKEWAIEEQIDHVVIIVNPKHESYYRTMGFHEINQSKGAPGLDKAPAVLMGVSSKEFFRQ